MAIRPVFTEIIWDSISQLDVSLENKSTWTGSFVQDESNAGNGGDGFIEHDFLTGKETNINMDEFPYQ